jgi:hypothetical protein
MKLSDVAKGLIDKEALRPLVREQLEWLEVFHQLSPLARVQEAISSDQICVYVTSGTPPSPKLPPPHRYLHTVSQTRVDQQAYAEVLKEESARWNAQTDAEKLAAAEARVGNKWHRDKLKDRLAKKGFEV